MKTASILTAAATVLALAGAGPALADPGNGKGNGHGKDKHHKKHDDDRKGERRHRGEARYVVGHCPPGLAKKDPACVPPGHAKKGDRHYGHRVGDVLRVRDYTAIRDYDRYDLQRRPGWDYYRDDDQVYRVDSNTRKVLAVINLIDAFSN